MALWPGWLSSLGLAHHIEHFEENNINDDLTFCMLNNDDLITLNVAALGDRKRILARIAEFNDTRVHVVPMIDTPIVLYMCSSETWKRTLLPFRQKFLTGRNPSHRSQTKYS